MLGKPPRPQHCQLCQRQTPHLTVHHLFPKSRHRDTKLVKLHCKQRLRLAVEWLCYACHKHLHRMINERDLAYHYCSLEKLQAHPDIDEFVQWLRTKPDDFTPKTSRRRRS